MQGFLRDLRHAFRGLLRTPGFTLVAVLTLAIGIAATATVYSWTQALFLAPLPGVPDQDTVRIFTGRTATAASGRCRCPTSGISRKRREQTRCRSRWLPTP